MAPLHTAAWANNFAAAELLVRSGADVNAKESVSFALVVMSFPYAVYLRFHIG